MGLSRRNVGPRPAIISSAVLPIWVVQAVVSPGLVEGNCRFGQYTPSGPATGQSGFSSDRKWLETGYLRNVEC